MGDNAGLYDETPVGIVDLATLPQGDLPVVPSWITEIPIPDGALEDQPTQHKKIKAAPDHIYKYTTEDGEPAFEVWRWNKSARREDKIIQPLSFGCSPDGTETGWGWHYPQAPRPLYNVAEVVQRPSDIVLLVSGEKVAEAVRQNRHLRSFVACAWAAGEASIHHNDWSPLVGRKVIFWRDNDEPGRRCAFGWERKNGDHVKGVLELLTDIGAACVVVDPPTMLPEGWDLADPLPAGIDEDGPLRYIETKYLPALSQKADEPVKPRPIVIEAAVSVMTDGAAQATLDFRPPEDVILRCTNYDENDTGNALRILAYKPDCIMWCPDLGYLAWDGKRWVDSKERAIHVSQTALSCIRYEVSMLEDARAQKSRDKFAKTSLNIGQVKSALEAMNPHAMVRAQDLNRNHHELNTQSGVVDLRTGAIKPHHASQRHTHICPVEVAPPGTPMPMFERFLKRILPDDDIRDYVQRMIGYFLTGMTSEQSFFFWYGQGSNGKGELIRIIQGIMGDGYARSELPVILMDASYNQQAEIAIGRMLGTRLVVTSEPSSNFVLAEGTVKLLTGQDKLAGRKLYKEGFNFEQTHKLMMNGNHKPRVKSGDEGTWRRIKLIPFNARIDEAERVDNISAVILETEGPAVLRWAIEGAQKWYAGRLAAPDAVRKEVEQYKEEENTVLQWIADACDYDPTVFVTTRDLYKNYQGWCETNFYSVLGARMFAVRLKENRLIKAGRGPQARGYNGLRLKNPDLSWEASSRSGLFRDDE